MSDNLENANESAKLARGHLFFAIPIYLYLAVAAASLDDVDFFLASPLTLPIVQTEVPLLAFFWIAPLLVCTLNQQLLMQMTVLRNRLVRVEKPERLNLYPFLAALAIADRKGSDVVGRLFAGATLIAAPLATALWLQLAFLRFQSDWTSALHTFATLIVVAQSLCFMRLLNAEDEAAGRVWFARAIRGAWAANRAGVVALGATAFFATFAAAPVGGFRDQAILDVIGHHEPPAACSKDRSGHIKALSPFHFLDAARGVIPFRRFIQIEGRDLSNTGDNAEDRNRSYRFSVSDTGRSFRLIKLLRVKLTNARFFRSPDFTSAHIDKSDLSGSVLSKEAKFTDACLRKSVFNGVRAVNAEFHSTGMAKTDWNGATLIGSVFKDAEMKHVSLVGANLAETRFLGKTNLERADARLANFSKSVFEQRVTTRYSSFVGAVMRGVAGVAPDDASDKYLAFADFRSAQTSEPPDVWVKRERGVAIAPTKQSSAAYGANGALRPDDFPNEDAILNYACALRPLVVELTCRNPYIGDALFFLYDDRELTDVVAPAVEGTDRTGEKGREEAALQLIRDLSTAEKTARFKVQDIQKPQGLNIDKRLARYADEQSAWHLIQQMHSKMLKSEICPSGTRNAGRTVYSSLSLQGQRTIDQKLRPNALRPALRKRAERSICALRPVWATKEE